MGVFTRMSNMIKGKVNSTLDDLENPIELLDQKIRDMQEQLSKAKANSAQVIGNVKVIEKNMNEAKKLSDDLDGKVKLALSKGNEALAKEALRRKVEADKKYESLKENHATASAQAEALKKNLAALEAEIEKTKSYRDEAAARYSTAKASKKVNEVLSDVQTKSNTIQIDNIERKIAKEEAAAQGLGDLRNVDDFDSQFEALNEVDLDAELEKYKSQQ
ncbi:MAG: PspA/IM30 family protein [Clostridium sp.]|nr:PspA/IM30 family protein [Clostridium sp.]